ncbi:MAG TPA: HD domain-containing phosphohydrolase [Syntrophorhabdales bacterium]|nr:HD domain-containing phosphohydrolase [Syntrophorhabdales bacterium]
MERNVLLVEDSKLQANVLTNWLRNAGYSTNWARDGLEGLYSVMSTRPNLIISDISMPRMNGYELCQAIKTDENLRDISVILVTGLTDTESIVHGLESGADYYLTKPYEERLLLSMIKSILTRKSDLSRTEREVFQVLVKGEERTFSAFPHQVLNFFLSTHENLMDQNKQLSDTKRELRKLNDYLEERVREKTRSLEAEIGERRKAERALRESLGNLRHMLDGTVEALANTMEIRDPYTAGHQRRVAGIAGAIAEAMAFSEDRIQGIRVMSYLHDIGKIVVPADILSKPGNLNEHERGIIRTHPRVGHDILAGIRFPWPVALAILQHHERLDGSGYPDGLNGSDITTEARILAVADVVESMSSHRPYRASLGINAALEEIRAKSGLLYDSDVVGACLDLFLVKGFTLE